MKIHTTLPGKNTYSIHDCFGRKFTYILNSQLVYYVFLSFYNYLYRPFSGLALITNIDFFKYRYGYKKKKQFNFKALNTYVTRNKAMQAIKLVTDVT